MPAFTTQLVRYLSTVANHRTDGDLLACFLTQNAEADFAELVRRYGPMVWGVCRRTLPDYSDAEDAFQAVFLVLVRRGNRLLGLPSVGPWLHRVAVWTARNVRRRNARQLAKRVMLPEQLPTSTIDVDLSLDLDAALLSLPEKFRSSIVLCHLLGFSRADAAAQLGCAERTLSSWLSRGLIQLRQKLRGLDPAKALGVAAVAIPVGLSDSVVRAAMSLQVAAVAASVLSSTVSQLVEGVIRMFWVKKATAAMVSLFAVFAFGVGVGVSTHQLSPAVGGDDKVVVPQPAANAKSAAEPDIDAKIAAIIIEIQATEVEFQTAVRGVKSVGQKIAFDKSAGAALQTIRDGMETLRHCEQLVENCAKRLSALKEQLKALQALKAQMKIYTPPAGLGSELSPAQKEMMKKIMDKLEKQEVQIDGNVNDMLLFDLLVLLSKKYDITFVITEEDFKAAKIPSIKLMKPKVASTKDLKGLKLGTFLDLVLASLDATYIVRPDYIEITTFEKRLEEKVARVFPDDPDKMLEDLKRKLARVQAEAEQTQAASLTAQAQYARKSEALKEQIHLLTASIADLQKEKDKQKEKAIDAKGPTAGKPTGAYLQLTIGAKDAAWPYQVKEFGADGKAIGTIAFENAEVFGRYLTRTMKDSTGPKELRIASRADTSPNLLISALEVCKAAGFKDVVVAKEGIDDETAARLAAYNALLEEVNKKALEQDNMKKLDKLREDRMLLQEVDRLRQLEILLKSKEDEIRKLKELNKQLKPGEAPGPEQQQQHERLLRDLDKLIEANADEIRRLKELKQSKPGEQPSPEKR